MKETKPIPADTSRSSEYDSGRDYDDHISHVSQQSNFEYADTISSRQKQPPGNLQTSADSTAGLPAIPDRVKENIYFIVICE